MSKLTPQLREEILAISNPKIKLRWQRFFIIPENLQDAMFDPPVADKIWDLINEKYDLGDNNVTKVARIIGLIFLGELPIKNFIIALQNELRINVQTATAIAQDINQAIFQPVKESLMMVHGLDRGSTPNQTRIHADSNADQRMDTNNTNRMTNAKTQMPNQYQSSNDKNPRPQTNNDYEAQRRREEVLNKIRNSQNGNGNSRNANGQPPRPFQPRPLLRPPQADYEGQAPARPASWRNPVARKNIIDLRNGKIKRKHDLFFTA